MKKLSLELDALKVQSFETDREPMARGTVQGHSNYTARCQTLDITCEATSPDPVGTCCHFQC